MMPATTKQLKAIVVITLGFLLLVVTTLPRSGAAVYAQSQNIALGADTSESDQGWGGGSSPGDMVDGLTYYADTWAHGLAFTGGVNGYVTPCGWRQATLNFGAMKTFNRALVWHHGADHIPNTYYLEYWDGSYWQATGGTSSIRWDLETPPAGVSGWGAIPTEHFFPNVTGSKIRFVLNNCDITHGWIYEFEVFNAQSYSILGQVIDVDNNPVASVTISTDTGQTSTTDSNGDYTLTGLSAGTYMLTPSKPGYTFSPSSIINITVPPDMLGQNFVATWTCPVPPLSPITDPLALSMENGNSLIWEPYTRPELNTARDTFVQLVQQRGWRVTFNSAYRPLSYQQHLYEVWTKLHDDPRIHRQECREFRAQLVAEATRHQLVKVLPPSPTGGHVTGRAFDATIFDEHDRVLNTRGRRGPPELDQLAAQAGVYRPYINTDPVHFELINP